MGELKDIENIPAKTRAITVGYICDCCGKEHKGRDFPDKQWQAFSIGIDLLGDDDHIVCSPVCFKKLIMKLNNRKQGLGEYVEFSTVNRTRKYYEEESDGRIGSELILELLKRDTQCRL